MNVYEVARLDPLVNDALQRGATMDQIIEVMHHRHEKLMERLIELESICPKRIKAPDGKIYVWHCPNELVPMTNA